MLTPEPFVAAALFQLFIAVCTAVARAGLAAANFGSMLTVSFWPGGHVFFCADLGGAWQGTVVAIKLWFVKRSMMMGTIKS
jgi:hypothetical protein